LSHPFVTRRDRAQADRMHRALGIFELVELICAELRHHRLQSLYSLARVCRSFSDSALDSLWMQQNTLTNILTCMPADLWEVDDPDHCTYVVCPALQEKKTKTKTKNMIQNASTASTSCD
jgi:hypothetical protein